MLAAGITAGLGALGGFMGGSQQPDYSGAAKQYQGQLKDLTQNLQPFVQGGQTGQQQGIALGQQQMAHPAAVEDQLAAGYTASPYQTQMLTNLAHMMNANAASTGMLGSTSANAALQNQLASMQNQFMNQYIDRGMQMYGMGSQNLNHIYNTMINQGFSAQQIADELQAQGFMAQMQGALMPTQQQSGITGALGGALGAIGTKGLGKIGKGIAGLF